MNLLSPENREAHLNKLGNGAFDVDIVTPPCHTHSRARHSEHPGPPPIRDAAHPEGFPWLQGKLKEQCETANSLVDLSLQALATGSKAIHEDSWRRTDGLMEHPEDLGSAAKGEPASV